MPIDFRLLAVSDRRLYAPSSLPDCFSTLSEYGIRAVLLREKDLDESAYAKLFNEVSGAIDRSITRIIIHSHSSIAERIDSDIHLTESQIGLIGNIRKYRSPAILIGASVHSVEAARVAEDLGASYLMFGPVFDTPSKRPFGPPQGLIKLSEVAAAVAIPVFAVGRILPVLAGKCIENGAYGVACVSALAPDPDLAHTVNAFRESLGSL